VNLSPIQLLREAIKAVPPLKYALGVVGLVAAVAIVRAFRINAEIAALGSVAILILMVALLIFARLTKAAKHHFMLPSLVMMWSFLLLVIAAAGLLFSSAFFGWPINFRALPRMTVSGRVEDLLKSAQLRLIATDYEGAWLTLQRAEALQSRSDALLATQADVAMLWLRKTVFREKYTFTEMADQLTPCLYDALLKSTGTRAGDVCAHIGWANYLKSQDSWTTTLDIDGFFQKALQYDQQNIYAQWEDREQADAGTVRAGSEVELVRADRAELGQRRERAGTPEHAGLDRHRPLDGRKGGGQGEHADHADPQRTVILHPGSGDQ